MDGGVFLVAIMENTLTQLNTLVITFPRSWKKMATFDLKVLKEHSELGKTGVFVMEGSLNNKRFPALTYGRY